MEQVLYAVVSPFAFVDEQLYVLALPSTSLERRVDLDIISGPKSPKTRERPVRGCPYGSGTKRPRLEKWRDFKLRRLRPRKNSEDIPIVTARKLLYL